MSEEDEVNEQESGAASYAYKYATGKTIAKYKVAEPLFHNGLGEVYRVQAENSLRPLNLRWLLGVSEEAAKGLQNLATVGSRYVVNLLDFKAFEGGVAVVTEPYGRTLRDDLRDKGQLSPEVAGDRISLILEALAALESADLLPSMVSPESVAVWDDGLALDEYYVPRLHAIGAQPIPLDRAPYLAPDLDPKDPKPQDALYGVGAILFEMLAGRTHLAGAPFEVISRAMHRDYQIEIPGPIGNLVTKLLAPRATDRFLGADEVLRMLSDLSAVPATDLGQLPPAVAETATDGGEPEASEEAGPRIEFVETNAQGLKVFARQPDDVRMVLIPGGTFTMGSPRGEEFNRKNELPTVEVTVRPFLIDEAPVTWEILLRLLQRTGSGHPLNADRKNSLPTNYGGDRDVGFDSRWYNHKQLLEKLLDNQPAVMITHEEASMLVAAVGLRLPSEAQWEYAYRGRTMTEFYWGDSMESDQAWYQQNASGYPESVRQMPPNPFGLFDMAGNIAEYCRDYYHKDVYKRVSGKETEAGPLSAEQLADGIDESSNRLSVRGGSWDSSEKALRAAFRADAVPDRPSLTAGFRCVIDGADPPDWAKAVLEESQDVPNAD